MPKFFSWNSFGRFSDRRYAKSFFTYKATVTGPAVGAHWSNFLTPYLDMVGREGGSEGYPWRKNSASCDPLAAKGTPLPTLTPPSIPSLHIGANPSRQKTGNYQGNSHMVIVTLHMVGILAVNSKQIKILRKYIIRLKYSKTRRTEFLSLFYQHDSCYLFGFFFHGSPPSCCSLFLICPLYYNLCSTCTEYNIMFYSICIDNLTYRYWGWKNRPNVNVKTSF